MIKVQETQGRNLKLFSYLSMHRKSSLGTFMPCLLFFFGQFMPCLLMEESNRSWQTGHCCSCMMYSLTSKINSWIVSWIGKKWIEYCTLQVNCTYLRRWIFCFKRLYWLEQFISIIIVQCLCMVIEAIYLLDRLRVKFSKLKTIWSFNILSNK